MDKFVKTVFTFLMWATIAWLAYLVLFGTYDFDGADNTGGNNYTGNITQHSEWKGLLWHAALSVEGPVSKYYHQFCFIPNVHAGDYIDEALGGSMNPSTYSGHLFDTETDVSLYDSDMYEFSGGYSTGWR